MTLLDACLWGMAGAGSVEVIDLYNVVKTNKNFPWQLKGELPLGLYVFCTVVRLALGAFAAVLCADGAHLSAAGAVAAGIAAPKILEELGRVGAASRGPVQPVNPIVVAAAVPPSTAEAPETLETAQVEGGPVDEA
jgi:hypothetical protein